ncbi:MAG: response regulator transcription factor [Lachnospiraceae bacterium]|nr:response regulator transcription factor [Lachnospiraceae bacterium]
MRTIAVIDDDVHIGSMLEEILTREGYRTLRAYSGTEALLLLEREQPDLLLLDLMLPGLSGEEVLKRISGIPVIVLSAKADIQDKVSLLLDGAADYMTKPFDTRELLARIAVQLRNASCTSSGVFTFGALSLDTKARTVSLNGTSVRLTRTEYAILKLLIQNPEQVLTKSLLLERISLDTPDCTESSLKIHVSNLRKKLKQIDGDDHIEAIWGIGFRLR